MSAHEPYVSLETAQMLKQAGFDWETREYYKFTDEEYRLSWNALPVNWNKKVAVLIAEKYGLSEGYSAPTLDVAQRWLREVMYIEVFVVPMDGADYVYRIVEFSPEYKNGRKDLEDTIHKSYKTYESALEAGINKCLTLLLKEKKQ